MFETLILMLDATIRTAPPLILAAMNDRNVLRVEGSPSYV